MKPIFTVLLYNEYLNKTQKEQNILDDEEDDITVI